MMSMEDQIAEIAKKLSVAQNVSELVALGREHWSVLNWHNQADKVWITTNSNRLEIRMDSINKFRTAENPSRDRDLFGFGGGKSCNSTELLNDILKFAGKNTI